MERTFLGCIFFTVLLKDGLTSEAQPWGYQGRNGVNAWPHSYPHCAGTAQSPINIVTKKVLEPWRRPRPFVTRRYDGRYGGVSNENMTLINNGHTVQVNLHDNSNTLTGGALFSTYVAAQFHFHWGSKNYLGSEHAIDGKLFPMEIHVVHFNRKYGTLDAAVDKIDGLAVLGTLVKVGRFNEKFQSIIKHFKNIQYKGNHYSIEPLPLSDFVSADMSMFYRYHGSLTTPPCYESVAWTVFNEPIQISMSQLEQFRTMLFQNDEHDTAKRKPLLDNYRPLQNRSGRDIYANRRRPIRFRNSWIIS